MEYINRVVLQGIVGCVRDNVVQGMTVQNFSLATEHRSKLSNGAIILDITHHQIVAWESVTVKKGDCVKVVGRLRTQKYTAADGTERVYYEVLASEVKIINE